MTLNTSKLSNTIASIEKNIQKYGMERFDPTDIRKIPIICKPYKWSKLLRKMVLAADNLSPILVRKALGITPTKLHVTAFTTLANAYLKMEASGIYKSAVYDSRYFVDLYVNDYVKGTDPNKWWQHKGLGINFFNINVGNKLATMHMHGLARANITLIDVGNFYMDKRYLDIATFSAFSVLDSHQVIDYKDGTKSVSYYYNSYDCTLNVNSEYAQWLSMLPQNCHNVKSLSVLNGILRLLLKEQNDDGSWYYFSRWHMETYRLTPSCDCHHSATVLYNMINITKCSYIEHNIKKHNFFVKKIKNYKRFCLYGDNIELDNEILEAFNHFIDYTGTKFDLICKNNAILIRGHFNCIFDPNIFMGHMPKKLLYTYYRNLYEFLLLINLINKKM